MPKRPKLDRPGISVILLLWGSLNDVGSLSARGFAFSEQKYAGPTNYKQRCSVLKSSGLTLCQNSAIKLHGGGRDDGMET